MFGKRKEGQRQGTTPSLGNVTGKLPKGRSGKSDHHEQQGDLNCFAHFSLRPALVFVLSQSSCLSHSVKYCTT
jgi:hypothetical protein